MNEKNVVIIDVRTPGEYAMGHAQNSVNLDFYAPTFSEEFQKLDKSKKYELYCRTGNRSGQAEAMMKQAGFVDVKNVGGLDEAGQLYKFG